MQAENASRPEYVFLKWIKNFSIKCLMQNVDIFSLFVYIWYKLDKFLLYCCWDTAYIFVRLSSNLGEVLVTMKVWIWLTLLEICYNVSMKVCRVFKSSLRFIHLANSWLQPSWTSLLRFFVSVHCDRIKKQLNL